MNFVLPFNSNLILTETADDLPIKTNNNWCVLTFIRLAIISLNCFSIRFITIAGRLRCTITTLHACYVCVDKLRAR